MISVINRRFGTSQRLELTNGDWVRNGMGAKTVNFNVGYGGLVPSVNWEDRSAAVALIRNPQVKAMACLLVWGSDAAWDRTEYFNEVVNHLSKLMLERCKRDGRKAPSNHSIEEMARLMARMTLHFELYQLWTVYTVEGQLFFSGIDMLAGTFNQSWSGYKNKMLDDLQDLTALVDAEISGYRFNLNRDCEVGR